MSQTPSKPSRRSFFAGAASVGAVAVGAAVLPAVRPNEAAAAAQPDAKNGGYRLSEHVKRYYQTTRV